MAVIKISQLPVITVINSNVANTILVGLDVPTNVTGQFTVGTLAAGLYSNTTLNVGVNPNTLPNTIAQFALSGESYIQTNLVNTNDGGTADMVVTANSGSGGTDSANFIDMGWANKNYQPGFEFNNIGTAVRPNDGYLYSQGTSGQPYGNLIIGTTSSTANLKFIVGGGSAQNVVAWMSKTGLVLNTQSSIVFADGTTQSTAAASNAYSVAAFNKANNALANSTGTFAGDLTITGNTFAQAVNTGNLRVVGTASITGLLSFAGAVSMNATIVVANSSFTASESALTVSGTTTYATPSNDGYMIHVSGKPNLPARIVSDAYGTGAYSLYAGRSARGNVANPTAIQSGDVMNRISGSGYGTTKYQTLGTTRIDFVATENYTDTTTGSEIQFWNCPSGSNTLTQIASFNGANVIFTGVVNPQKGFIWSPTQYPGAQTAITVDFSTNSVVRTNTSSGLVVSFANYTVGKVVDMWITNTAGTTQTFTHGCSALNSTVNALTYSMPSTSTIYVKYMCFGSDIANTFVAITHT